MNFIIIIIYQFVEKVHGIFVTEQNSQPPRWSFFFNPIVPSRYWNTIDVTYPYESKCNEESLFLSAYSLDELHV